MSVNLSHAVLLDPGSLTALLKAAYGPSFAVDFRGLKPRRLNLAQARQLAVRPGTRALEREVSLLGGGQVRVRAWTVMPEPVLRGPALRLKHLRTRPLGEVLFGLLDGERIEFEVWPWANDWVRRSVFRVASGRILVVEHLLGAEAGDP